MADNAFSAKAALQRLGETEGLSEDQAKFFQALDNLEFLENIRERHLAGERNLPDRALSEEEVENINRFSPALDLVGTEREAELENFIQSPGILLQTIKTPEQAAFQAGARAPGIVGDVMTGDIMGIVQQAMQETETDETGAPSFDSFMTNVQRIRAEKEAQREKVKLESPTATGIGEAARDVAIGGGVGGTIATGLKAIPRIKAGLQAPGIKSLVSPTGRAIAGAGAGTTVVEALQDETATPEDVAEAGLAGAAIEGVLRLSSPGVTRAFSIPKAKLGEYKEDLLNRAGELAFRAIQPVKRTMIRGIERGGDSRSKIGRILLEENIMPKFPPFFLDSQVGVRLDRALQDKGSKLGALRDRASNFSKKIMRHIDQEFNSADVPEDKLLDVVDNLNDLEKKLHVQTDRLADRLEDVIKDVDPTDVLSDPSKAANLIKKQVEQLRGDPVKFRTIDEALQWKANVRKTLQQKGSLTIPGSTEAAKRMEMILADEIDMVVARNLILDKRLGGDFSINNITKVFGDVAEEIAAITEKVAKSGGFENLSLEDKTDFVRLFEEHNAVQGLYRVLAKSGDLLGERELAKTTNNLISLRDTILGGVGGAGFGIEAGLLTAVTSNILRGKGVATGARAMQQLSQAVGRLQMVAGDAKIGLETMADSPLLTPAIYKLVTTPDSPLNIHGMVLIDDPASLTRIIENITNDDDLSSVMKAKQINSIIKNGHIKLFNPDFKREEGQKEPEPDMSSLSRDIERVMGTPSFEAELDVGRQ